MADTQLSTHLPSLITFLAPAQHVLKYEVSTDNDVGHKHSKYTGQPTEANQKAWADLLKPLYFNATRDELVRAGEALDRAVEFQGEDMLELLRCIMNSIASYENLRFFVYREHYYPNITDVQHNALQGHLDHCIEQLRIATMCQSNTAMYSFHWRNPKAYRPSTESSGKAVCAKWSTVENWARSRMSGAQFARLADVEE
ncbi:hypothetical protein PT974_11159 [Cladobotryum mycophilum]|uniref:Uncharacterized protein n=1 Tax=Cladobotryum mycophilum TaxID=491253 RepID=A0ABR0S4K2_9HYPO